MSLVVSLNVRSVDGIVLPVEISPLPVEAHHNSHNIYIYIQYDIRLAYNLIKI